MSSIADSTYAAEHPTDIGTRRSRILLLARNATALLSSDVVDRAAVFAIYALVARYLGAYEFGQLAIALTLLSTFQVLAVAGAKTLITREVARDRSASAALFLNGSIVVLVTSLAALVLLALFVRLMQYAPDTSAAIVLLGWALLPYSLSAICEAVLQGIESMAWIAAASVPVNIAKVLGSVVLLTSGYGLRPVLLLVIVGYTLILLVEWFVVLRKISRQSWSFELSHVRNIARGATTFLGMEGVIAMTSASNIILLSKFAGESATAYYNAATQLLVPAMLMNKAVMGSVFPMMCRRFGRGIESLALVGKFMIALLLALAFPILVMLLLRSGQILDLLYGQTELAPASAAVSVIAWTLLFVAITNVFGPMLLASMREKLTVKIFGANALLTVVCGVLLIPQFGFMGAAFTALVTRVANFAQLYRPLVAQLPPAELLAAIWKPALAAVAMGAALVALPAKLVVSVTAGTCVYVVTLLAVTVLATGGTGAFRAAYADWVGPAGPGRSA